MQRARRRLWQPARVVAMQALSARIAAAAAGDLDPSFGRRRHPARMRRATGQLPVLHSDRRAVLLAG